MRRQRRATLRESTDADALIDQIKARSLPLRGERDLDPLLERVGDARYVLLGEASHGTSEYYTWRAAISRRLIEEKGFRFIAVEGDWPDCYRVNRYVKGYRDAGASGREVLHAFVRWPTWMWANEEVVALAEWLRGHNRGRPAGERVGFYGLDVYSLWESLYAVMRYLRRVDPSALPAARAAYRCFEPYAEDAQDYARATVLVPESCQQEAVALLAELRRRVPTYPDGDREEAFQAEQNALVVKHAEEYYRAMVRGGPDSWNVRDRHMNETLDRLVRRHGPKAKGIVWEHNTHVGDARHTDMADDGMVNVGQLVREGHAAEGVVLVGFGSYQGTVIAGKEWDAPMERMTVPPGREGSWEQVLHAAGADDKLLVFEEPTHEMLETRGHRAIGVVYQPEYEGFGNYVPSVLPRRYDAFVFLDRTTALRPLQLKADTHKVPETFPSGV